MLASTGLSLPGSSEKVAQEVEEGMKQLFDPDKPHDLNSRGFDDESTPLHLASTYGHLEIARILVEHGVGATACDNWRRTPLHAASEYGHLEVVRFLLEHGADMTARDNEGATPFQLASIGGHVELMHFLVGQGADIQV
jgi:ankyrin repeat protein